MEDFRTHRWEPQCLISSKQSRSQRKKSLLRLRKRCGRALPNNSSWRIGGVLGDEATAIELFFRSLLSNKTKFLEEKEARNKLDTDNQAHPAFRKPHKRSKAGSTSTSESESETRSGTECYLWSEPHYMWECPGLRRARKLLDAYKTEKKLRKKKQVAYKALYALPLDMRGFRDLVSNSMQRILCRAKCVLRN